MFQVRYIHFLKFWVEQTQAFPNSVWWLPNSRILFPTSPNMSGKPIKIIHSLKNVTTWNLLKNQLCHEVHGKDEWLMIHFEGWNSKPMPCRYCLKYTGSLKKLILNIILNSLDLNFGYNTWNKSWYIHIVSLESNSSSKLSWKRFSCETHCFSL